MNIDLPPFYVGQKVAHVGDFDIWYDNDNNIVPGPRRNETVTVTRLYREPDTGIWCIDLKEYPPNTMDDGYLCWDECGNPTFTPLLEATLSLISYSKVLEEVLVCEN